MTQLTHCGIRHGKVPQRDYIKNNQCVTQLRRYCCRWHYLYHRTDLPFSPNADSNPMKKMKE